MDGLTIADRLLRSSNILVSMLAVRLVFDITENENIETNKLFAREFMMRHLAGSMVSLIDRLDGEDADEQQALFSILNTFENVVEVMPNAVDDIFVKAGLLETLVNRLVQQQSIKQLLSTMNDCTVYQSELLSISMQSGYIRDHLASMKVLDRIVSLLRSSVEVEKTPADLQEVVLNIMNTLVIACLSTDC